MKRRTAIRNMVIISAGAAFLPSCRITEKTGLVLKNISVSNKEQKMLAVLTETIIPKTNDFIGANDLAAHEFVLTMVDDCNSPDQQKAFTDGLQAFDELCHDKFGQIFTGFTAEQRNSLLSDLENKKEVSENALQFYRTVRKYTQQSFTSSKDYMLDIRKYKMIPGSYFKGCVKIAS